MNKKGLENLQVWHKARGLAVLVCKELLLMFPDEEKFALSQQLRRAVQSVPANIAEAHGRYHYQDAIRFCYIARGSLDETLSHLILAHDLGYIPDDSLVAYREI
jgi:four helix bundle protein